MTEHSSSPSSPQGSGEGEAGAQDGHTHRIAVVGFGPIGRALSRAWLDAGHDVVIGNRNPDRLAGDLTQFPGARCTQWTSAIADCDVVALAVPYPALDDVVADPARLAGKVVIDPSNPVQLSADGRIVSGLDAPGTVGQALAGRVPEAFVVRAFTHVMHELLATRGQVQPGLWAMAMAGDDVAAKELVAGLVRATGFVPVDLGGLPDSAPLDPGGVLFPNMFTVADMHHRLAKDGNA
jgi:predicted dinucleotide-binding enzyme